MTTVWISGEPVAKQRARTVNGHTYTPPKTRAYEELVAVVARSRGKQYPNGDVSVEISLCSPRKLRGDIDNYAKAVLDGIVKGGLIGDDRQISRLLIEKRKTNQARGVVVKVEPHE